MFVANYGLKHFVQKAAMVARLPLGYAQSHPYTGLQARAHATTLDFITDNMANSIAFDTPRELMGHAVSLVKGEGLCAEFGVNEGGTISFIGRRLSGRTIHGFDSFEGLPENWQGNKMHAGFFDRGGRLPRVPSNVVLHPGWFENSLPKFLAVNEGPAAFLHVDCDLYSSTRTVFDTFGPRIVPGTVIVFDEYFNYPAWQVHEHKAFGEFKDRSGLKFDYVGYSVQQIVVVARG